MGGEDQEGSVAESNGTRGDTGDDEIAAAGGLDDKEIPRRRGRSLADHYFRANKAVIISFDMETAGEHVGIVQLSAEVCRVAVKEEGKSYTKDTQKELSIGPGRSTNT